MEHSPKLRDILLVGMAYKGDPTDKDFARRRAARWDEADLPYDVCSQVLGREDGASRFDEDTTGGLARSFETWLREGKPSNDAVKRTAESLLGGGDVHEMLAVCRTLGLGASRIPNGTTVDDLDHALEGIAVKALSSKLQSMVDRWDHLDFYRRGVPMPRRPKSDSGGRRDKDYTPPYQATDAARLR
jgi:hypothetical protein